MKLRTLIHLTMLMIPALASAATITVRRDGTGNYATIQPALDAAADGDTILIGPGEYPEHATMRLPEWNGDIESFANVTVDDLTIIGSGANETIIGPTEYLGGSWKLITYNGGGDLTISGLCLRNGAHGVYVAGRLFLDDCAFVENMQSLEWMTSGSGGHIRNCHFESVGPWGESIIEIRSNVLNTNADILVEDCLAVGVQFYASGVRGVTFRRCEFTSVSMAMGVYGGSQVLVDTCRFSDTSTAVELNHYLFNECTITHSELSASWIALLVYSRYGRFVVTNSRIVGGYGSLLFTDSEAGSSLISGCDLVKGSGPIIECGDSGLGSAVHDLRNNYWGTNDESTIRSWIIEGNRQTVLYSPFAGQSVPTESTSWGDLKALFR